MAKKKTSTDLVAQLRATGLQSEVGLRALRTTVKAASKNKRVPKGLRRNLRKLLPAIQDAEKSAIKRGRSRKVKRARKEFGHQLSASFKQGSEALVKASAPVVATKTAEKAVKAGRRARKRAAR